MAAKKKAAPKAEPSQAEVDYSTGARKNVPLYHELSPSTQQVVADSYRKTMSNWRSQAEEDVRKGLKDTEKWRPGTVEALSDTDVGIEEAGRNLAGYWNRMMDAEGERPGSQVPGWYFGGRRILRGIANRSGMNEGRVIDSSAAMSPNNSPTAEWRAVGAMSDAVSNRRMIQHPALGRRRMTSLTPDEMQFVTSKEQEKKTKAAKGFDIAGFRSGGVSRRQGWKTLLGSGGYNAVEDSEAAKIDVYAQSYKEAIPDSPLHDEYLSRFYDQMQARRVRQAREEDARLGRTGSETIRGVPDRVDVYGLMKGTDDPDDPAYNHPILGEQGLAVPDTWMNAILSGQPIEDQPGGASSPAKAVGSTTSRTQSSPSGGTAVTGKTEAEKLGGKPFSATAAHGVASIRAMQVGAKMAREPESQTNIPPMMAQEMPWKFVRNMVADSHEQAAAMRGERPNAARLAVLRGGGLAEESQVQFPSNVVRSSESFSLDNTPGAFFRGWDHPLDTDSVTVTNIPSPSSSSANLGRRTMPYGGANVGASDSQKIAAIRNAQKAYRERRADGSSAWSDS